MIKCFKNLWTNRSGKLKDSHMLQRWKQLNNNYSSNEWFFGSFCVQIVISRKIPCGFEAAWKVSHHLVWCSLVLSYGYWNVTQSFVLMWIRAMFLLSSHTRTSSWRKNRGENLELYTAIRWQTPSICSNWFPSIPFPADWIFVLI